MAHDLLVPIAYILVSSLIIHAYLSGVVCLIIHHFVHTSKEGSGETACIAKSILDDRYQNLSCWPKLYIVHKSLLEIHGYIYLTSGSVVVDSLLIVTYIVRVCNCSMFCCTLFYVHSSFAITLMWKRELVALLSLISLCLVMVVWFFLAVPWGCLQFVIVVFPDHTHLLFFIKLSKLKRDYF